jgi:hypothetical protein
MTDQHRATPEQWKVVEICSEEGKIPWPTADCILELRDTIRALCIARNDLVVCSTEQNQRIEALEAAQLEQAESHRFCTDGITLSKLATGAPSAAQALDREDPSPDAASAEPQPAWRPLDIETTYGSEAAADAAQILHAPMVVEGTFDHGGETYRYKANATPERDPAMPELRAASAKARPTVKDSLTDGGSLLEMVAKAIYNVPHDSAAEARAAIREVAKWLRSVGNNGSADELEQQADHG